MRSRTVIVSVVIHAGFGFLLMSAAKQRVAARKRSISVSMTEEKKKAEQPNPAPKPRPVRVASIPRVPLPSAIPEIKSASAAAPKAVVAMPLELSNADLLPGGIAVPGTPRAAPVTKVASVGPPPDRRRRDSQPGSAIESFCTEEPTKPEPLFKTEIEYTVEARAAGVEGRLKLRLTIDKNGSVSNVEVLLEVSPQLDGAAVAAAKLWRFKPAMACGKPVEGGTYVLARKFELGD